MTIRHLDKAECQPYFERISRELSQQHAEVDVTALGLRTPSERDWTPLKDVAYDAEKDTFQLVTADLDHLIPHPQALHIDAADDGLHAIEVVDADGNPRLIRLRAPLPMAAPEQVPR
jgi:hypothetical protein